MKKEEIELIEGLIVKIIKMNEATDMVDRRNIEEAIEEIEEKLLT